MGRDVLLAKGLSEFALSVLHAMAFVDNNVLPLDLAKCGLIVQNILVRRQHNVEFFVFKVLRQDWPLVLLPFVGDDTDGRGPSLKLTHPVVDCSQGHHNQKRAFVSLVANKVREEGDSLNGFAKTHLISEDSVEVVVIERDHPV